MSAIVIALIVSVAGCSSAITELGPGDTYQTQSGLSLTVPVGATATITRPSRDEIQPDVPFTELVTVEVGESLAVSFMSFSGTERGETSGSVLAAGAGVSVRDVGAETLRVVIETDLKGAAPGRVVVIVPDGAGSDLRGRELAAFAWNELAVRGVELP